MSNHNQNVSELCAALAKSGRATPDDVRRLRRAAMVDGRLERDEVEAALAADKLLSDRSQDWVWWLREITVDHLFGVGADRKVLSQEKANWLLSAVGSMDGQNSRARLEVVVRVVETACSMPDAFYQAVLNTFAHAVTANQKDGEPIICAEDAAQLRRVLYASAGDDSFAISRTEAEFLFDLNDRTSEMGNSAEWTQLFVQAIGNHLMASFGHGSSDRRAALDDIKSPDGFWAKMTEDLPGLLRSLSDRMNEHHSASNEAFVSRADAAERITDDEGKWVFERIGRKGGTDATEQALLESLRLDNAA